MRRLRALALGAYVAMGTLAVAGAAPAVAADLTIALPDNTPVHQVKTAYDCPTLGVLTVAYITAGDTALAVMPLDGRTLIFANVLAASGARYAAGPYVWWTTGTAGALYDLRKGEGAAPLACTAKS